MWFGRCGFGDSLLHLAIPIHTRAHGDAHLQNSNKQMARMIPQKRVFHPENTEQGSIEQRRNIYFNDTAASLK